MRDLREQALGDVEANFRGALARAAHGGADLGRNADAGYLVVQELGVALRMERQDAQQHGPRQAAASAPRRDP